MVADLANRVCADLAISEEKIIAFSDSTTVLCWLSKPSDSWKVYVKNRVDKIVNIIPFSKWRYVKSHANPADMATRGLSAGEFREDLQKWFDGPEFIRREDADSFFSVPDLRTHECLEKRKLKGKTFACVSDKSCSRIIERFSSYTRLLNSFARLVRVAKFWKTKVRAESSVFTKLEYDNARNIIIPARNIIIRMCQSEAFSVEIECLKNGAPLKKKSSIRSLDPFLDKDELLRVGGRLSNNLSLPLEKKHPLIVTGKSSLSDCTAVTFMRSISMQEKNFYLRSLLPNFGFTRVEPIW